MHSLPCLAIFASLVLVTTSATSLHAEDPLPDPDKDVVTLPQFDVKATAHCNFGFGIVVFGDVKAGTISRVLVDDVVRDSEASRLGIEKGDEILAVNGKRVSDMKGGMKGGSDLFRLLINRPPGERIDVEVKVRVVKKVVLIAGPSV
jgi:S1-C subfamily serine protease